MEKVCSDIVRDLYVGVYAHTHAHTRHMAHTSQTQSIVLVDRFFTIESYPSPRAVFLLFPPSKN